MVANFFRNRRRRRQHDGDGPPSDDEEGPGGESLFRSSPMSLIQLYIPVEAAQAVTLCAGDLGLVQFRDLNVEVSAFQKTFTAEIRQLYGMERKIQTLKAQAEKADVEIQPWNYAFKRGPFGRGQNLIAFLEELEGILGEVEGRVVQMSRNREELEERLKGLVQLHDVIVGTLDFLEHAQDEQRTLGSLMDLDGFEKGVSGLFDVEKGASSAEMTALAPETTTVGFIVGVIDRKRLAPFQRVLWRSLRGNVIIKSTDIPTGDNSRSAFVAFVHGRETLARAKKICEALGCTLYALDTNSEVRRRLFDENASKIDDLEAILYNTKEAIRAELLKIADNLEMWHVAVRRQIAVYAALNKFSCDNDVSARRCFIAEGWCPKSAVVPIDISLKEACRDAGLNMVPVLTVLDNYNLGPGGAPAPPTHFPTNKLTVAFQEMTEAYGIASYGEANPSVYMIITFPFLFAVMFGDVGHGLIMAIFAGYLVFYETSLAPKLKGELWDMIFGGRYVIFLMGLFSIFTGFIYNDVFSKTLPLFPSMFFYRPGETTSVRVSESYVYPFGLDPAWHGSENGMTFSNSYKMKQSILLGLVQMTYGIFLSLTNMLHFGETLDIICTFVPQLLFMLSLFGYLAVLIVAKWITGADVSLLNLFITMVLGFGAIDGPALYPGQRIVQTILVIIAFACIPWLLLAKPIYVLLEKHRIRSQGYDNTEPRGSGESISSTARKIAASGAGEDGHGGFGDLMVHQLIHTIEFVLGSVSNTASYLRLWALSLAHAQLSEVLWDMTLGMTMHSIPFLVIGFAAWFIFTIGVMVMMEGMSAFLHALRLHWVEFNNKFYRGAGVKFEPFRLDPDILLRTAATQESK